MREKVTTPLAKAREMKNHIDQPVNKGKRAEATWGKYTRFELSPLLQSHIDTYNGMRAQEREAYFANQPEQGQQAATEKAPVKA